MYNIVVFPVPPEIHSWERTLEVTAGDDLNIICEASGNPVPRVSWRRYETGRSISGGGQRVTLTNVTRSDAGLYVCTADNGVTQPVERITKILVRRKSLLLSIQLYLTLRSIILFKLVAIFHSKYCGLSLYNTLYNFIILKLFIFYLKQYWLLDGNSDSWCNLSCD